MVQSVDVPMSEGGRPGVVDDPVAVEDSETTREALAYLKALEESESFEPGKVDAPPPVAPPRPAVQKPRIEYTAPGVVPRSYQAPEVPPLPQVTAVGGGAPTRLPLPKDLRNIEDVYAAYDVGNGNVWMRFERTQPKQWRGVSAVGFIGDVHEQITMQDFVNLFGGGVYNVHIIGPASTSPSDVGSPPRTLTTVELRVSGPPMMDMAPYSSEELSMQPIRPGTPRQPPQQQPQYSFLPPGFAAPPEAVQIREIEARERAIERENERYERLMRQAQPPQAVLDTANDIAKEAVGIARASADEKVQILREQNQNLIEENRQKDADLRVLRDKLSAAERAASEARQYHETEQIRQIKEAHAATVSKMQDDHVRDMNRVQQESRDKLQDETRRHTDERSKSAVDAQQERERLREEAAQRAQSIKEQYEMQRSQMKEQYEARINDLERRTADQIAAVKEQRDRELEAVRTIERSNSLVVEKTTKVTSDSLSGRMKEMQEELDRLRRDNEDLRKKSVKDPVTYIQEVSTFAREVLGMVKPEEIEKDEPAAAPGVDTSWKGMATKGLMSLVDNIPKIVENVGQMRAANQVQQQQMVAQQQQMVAQQQAMMGRQLPPGPPQAGPPQLQGGGARRRGGLAAPAPWASAASPIPPAPGAALGMPVPHVGPVVGPPPAPMTRPAPSVVTGLQDNTPAGPPVTGEWVFESKSPLQPHQEAQQQVVAPPQPEPPQAAPIPSQGSAPKVTQEQMGMFVTALNSHIGEGTPPSLFAMGFVEQVGKDVARDLITQVSAKAFLGAIEEHGVDESQTVILTLSGREYVEKVWSEAKKICAS